MRKRRPRVTTAHARGRARASNPRYDRSLPRSGRLPITLIDGSTRAAAAASIQAIAAAIHYMRPCYAIQLQRVAAQVRDSYTATQAVTNYATTPWASGGFTDHTVTTSPVVTRPFADRPPDQTGP